MLLLGIFRDLSLDVIVFLDDVNQMIFLLLIHVLFLVPEKKLLYDSYIRV